MSGIDALLGCAVLLLLVFPGVFLVFVLFPRRSLGEVFFAGSVVGWSLVVLTCRLFPLSWSPVVLGALYVATGAAALRAVFKPSEEKVNRLPGGALVWVVALAALLLQLIPAMSGSLPPGRQPMYHLVLVAKILLEGHIPHDWLPFADIPVNYPLGSHLWVALVSRLSALPAHSAFRISFVGAAFLTGGMMYLLSMQIFNNDKRASFFAVLLWITASYWGGRELFMQGQLPHMLGMLLLMCLLWIMLAESGVRAGLTMGIIAGGILYCHHHTVLVAAGVAAMLMVVERRVQGRFAGWSGALVAAAAIGAILVPGGVIKGIGMLISPAGTDLYKFREFFVPIQRFIQLPGVVVSFTGALGVALLIARPSDRRRLIPVAWIAVLLGMLALFGYLYRVVMFGYRGEFYAMFTPSALIVSMVYPLCLAGGWFIGTREGYFRFRAVSVLIGLVLYIGLNCFREWSSLSGGEALSPLFIFRFKFAIVSAGLLIVMWLSTAARRSLAEYTALVVVALLFTGWGVYYSNIQANRAAKFIRVTDLKDLHAMSKYISPDTIIVNRPIRPYDRIMYGWVPYWTMSECSHFTLPSTEKRNAAALKRKLKALEGNIYETILRAHLQAMPVVLLTTRQADFKSQGFRTIYESRHRRFQLYEPGER